MTPEIEHALKANGHRLTHPRRAVVRELGRIGRLISAERVHDRIKQEHPEVGLSTVYRTLNLLERLGVARRKNLGEGYARYELRTGKPHHHARCLSCGAVIDFSETLLDYLALQVERESGFVADSHELTLHGRCAACAAREPKAPARPQTRPAPSRCPAKDAEKPARPPHRARVPTGPIPDGR